MPYQGFCSFRVILISVDGQLNLSICAKVTVFTGFFFPGFQFQYVAETCSLQLLRQFL
jgi:hypothetical protein